MHSVLRYLPETMHMIGQVYPQGAMYVSLR